MLKSLESTPSEFYKYKDDDPTRILDKHKDQLEEPYKNDEIDLKTMYMELIRLLNAKVDEDHPEGGFRDLRDVTNLQGFQNWTNRLQWSLNKTFMEDIDFLKDKISEQDKVIVLLKSQGGNSIALNLFGPFFGLPFSPFLKLLTEIPPSKRSSYTHGHLDPFTGLFSSLF